MYIQMYPKYIPFVYNLEDNAYGVQQTYSRGSYLQPPCIIIYNLLDGFSVLSP